MPLKLKYCGIRHASEYLYAKELGVHFVGMVHFSPSPRHCSEETLQTFEKELPILNTNLNSSFTKESNENPSCKKVLVLVNENIAGVINLVKKYSFNVVQLHGDEDMGYVQTLNEQLKKSGLKTTIWKALRLKKNDEITAQLFKPFTCVSHFIVEPFHKDYGGMGNTLSVQLLQAVLIAAKNANKKIIAAGGINNSYLPAFKKLALEFENFYALDISSGIEKTRGIKDLNKMKSFKAQFNALFL